MGRAQEYRRFAGRCLQIAQGTANSQTKAAMLQMAQVWSRLAGGIDPSGQDFPDVDEPDQNLSNGDPSTRIDRADRTD
jgi:hypothetical protein